MLGRQKFDRFSFKRFFCVSFISLFLLTGCLKEKLDHWLNEETYLFSGTYDNQYNNDTLVFRDGSVLISSPHRALSVPYEVDGTLITIQVRNNSKEKRPDIVMRIHGDGEVLTCSACAKYNLSNIWVKVNFIPRSEAGTQ
ncbi:hypothetical protein [Vibrio salinus]|uniref:hypothetical protein n=1 Tax=Vibrio salinus TaxID=2899784 RepID=UPI001E296AB5|nr:hypothetical protein [Vibrio salinus]MCE0495113.1 hypothetical protein [Vibrio salinus]